jgi:hypothetical protein
MSIELETLVRNAMSFLTQHRHVARATTGVSPKYDREQSLVPRSETRCGSTMSDGER